MRVKCNNDNDKTRFCVDCRTCFVLEFNGDKDWDDLDGNILTLRVGYDLVLFNEKEMT